MIASPTLPTNGAVIRALRSAYGLRMTELAAAAEISEGFLSKIETGRQDASLAVLRRIADRLHVPLDAVVRCKVPESLVAA